MARRNTLIAALLVAVMAGHAVLLQWLASQAREQAALRLMPTPMFTRLLQPQAPAPPPEAAAAPKARVPRAPAVIQSVAPSAPREITSTVAKPDVASPPGTDAAALVPVAPEDIGASEPEAPEAPIAAEAPAVDATTPTPSSSLGTTTSTATAVATATASATATGTATATPGASSPATATPTTAAASTPVTQAALDSWPVDTRLNYSVGGYYRGDLHGTARVQWQRQGDRYQTRIDIDLGVITQVMTSQGEVTQNGLSPRAYEESRTGKRRSVVLQDSQIVLSDGKQVPRPEGVQDTASQFVELSHRFASGQLALEVGRSVSFWMARPGGVDLWTYDVVRKEMLQTPRLGAVEAFHLKPRPLAHPRGNITAEMWFAPSLQYLPIRIRVSTGDAHVDLFVDKIEQR